MSHKVYAMPTRCLTIKKEGATMRKIIAATIIISLFVNALLDKPALSNNQAGQSLALNTIKVDYPHLYGISFNPNQSFTLDFYVNNNRKRSAKTTELFIKYFLSFLTIPKEKLWVNLSVYEQDRIMPEILENLDVGKDFLAQDYSLKQLTGIMTDPNNYYGRKFWQWLNKITYQYCRTLNLPIDMAFKVWIKPEIASIGEREIVNSEKIIAFIKEAKLRVCLQEDKQIIEKHPAKKIKLINSIYQKAKEQFQKEIIPIIEREVNYGERFIRLRQLYYAFILADYFKKKLVNHREFQAYFNQEKIKTIALNPQDKFKDRIYQLYLKEYKSSQNVFQYGKIKRRYYSGGMQWNNNQAIFTVDKFNNDDSFYQQFNQSLRQATLVKVLLSRGREYIAKINIKMVFIKIIDFLREIISHVLRGIKPQVIEGNQINSLEYEPQTIEIDTKVSLRTRNFLLQEGWQEELLDTMIQPCLKYFLNTPEVKTRIYTDYQEDNNLKISWIFQEGAINKLSALSLGVKKKYYEYEYLIRMFSFAMCNQHPSVREAGHRALENLCYDEEKMRVYFKLLATTDDVKANFLRMINKIVDEKIEDLDAYQKEFMVDNITIQKEAIAQLWKLYKHFIKNNWLEDARKISDKLIIIMSNENYDPWLSLEVAKGFVKDKLQHPLLIKSLVSRLSCPEISLRQAVINLLIQIKSSDIKGILLDFFFDNDIEIGNSIWRFLEKQVGETDITKLEAICLKELNNENCDKREVYYNVLAKLLVWRLDHQSYIAIRYWQILDKGLQEDNYRTKIELVKALSRLYVKYIQQNHDLSVFDFSGLEQLHNVLSSPYAILRRLAFEGIINIYKTLLEHEQAYKIKDYWLESITNLEEDSLWIKTSGSVMIEKEWGMIMQRVWKAKIIAQESNLKLNDNVNVEFLVANFDRFKKVSSQLYLIKLLQLRRDNQAIRWLIDISYKDEGVQIFDEVEKALNSIPDRDIERVYQGLFGKKINFGLRNKRSKIFYFLLKPVKRVWQFLVSEKYPIDFSRTEALRNKKILRNYKLLIKGLTKQGFKKHQIKLLLNQIPKDKFENYTQGILKLINYIQTNARREIKANFLAPIYSEILAAEDINSSIQAICCNEVIQGLGKLVKKLEVMAFESDFNILRFTIHNCQYLKNIEFYSKLLDFLALAALIDQREYISYVLKDDSTWQEFLQVFSERLDNSANKLLAISQKVLEKIDKVTNRQLELFIQKDTAINDWQYRLLAKRVFYSAGLVLGFLFNPLNSNHELFLTKGIVTDNLELDNIRELIAKLTQMNLDQLMPFIREVMANPNKNGVLSDSLKAIDAILIWQNNNSALEREEGKRLLTWLLRSSENNRRNKTFLAWLRSNSDQVMNFSNRLKDRNLQDDEIDNFFAFSSQHKGGIIFSDQQIDNARVTPINNDDFSGFTFCIISQERVGGKA